MNINIKRFFLLQPPSLKDEGHPDHLQRFHHRCNHINIITGPGYIVKKWQKIQLSGRAQYNTASQNKNWKRQISVGACENLAVLLAVLLLPRLRNARHFSIQGLICSEAQDNCDFLPPLSILNTTFSGTFSSSISHCPTSGFAWLPCQWPWLRSRLWSFSL